MVLDRVKKGWGKFGSYLEGLGKPESRPVDEQAELPKCVPTATVLLSF